MIVLRNSSVWRRIILFAATSEIWWVTRTTNSSLLKGFEIKSFAPTLNPFTISEVVFKAVRKIIGIFWVTGFAFSFSDTSKPFISGIITSNRIRSGCFSAACTNASLPLFAVTTLNFSFVSNTFNSNTLETTSSTTKMVYSEWSITTLTSAVIFATI